MDGQLTPSHPCSPNALCCGPQWGREIGPRGRKREGREQGRESGPTGEGRRKDVSRGGRLGPGGREREGQEQERESGRRERES